MSTKDNNMRWKAALLGHPVAQSLSPLMHGYWFEATGLKGQYQAIDVEAANLQDTINWLKADAFAGFNITVPHKTAVIPFLDRLTPLARQMGAVNTVVIGSDGRLTGFNTDGIGFMKHLNLAAGSWPKDKPVLLLGAGGAARAAALALVNEGVPLVMVANRTRDKAQAVADEIGRGRMTVVEWRERQDAVPGAGLIVNTTTLGMVGQSPLLLDLTGAANDTVVYDIVYKPLETPLLAAAKRRGLRTVDGLGMLVHQGAAAFKLWFDRDVGFDDTLRERMLAALGAEDEA